MVEIDDSVDMSVMDSINEEARVNADLYEAGLQSLASEASANNTYEKIATTALGYKTSGDFLEEMNRVETKIKSEFSLTKMPNPWRSAKSILSTCLEFNLAITDDNGSILGKSALQAKIRDVKSSGKTTHYEVAHKAAMSLVNISSVLSPMERELIKAMINSAY